MKTLEVEFVSGEGGFSMSPLTYKQIQRNEVAAIYQRFTKEGLSYGFEVFKIKVRLKGTQIFSKITEEDEECYPGSSDFGRTAWSCSTLERAQERFGEIITKLTEPEEAPQTIMIPVGEFSIKEFAEANKIDYPIAFNIVKKAIENNSVKFIREERRASRGKLTKLYAKIL